MAKPTKPAIRILMADDHPIFRDGVRKLLESDDSIAIVGEVSNGSECIAALGKLSPTSCCWTCACRRKTGSPYWRK
jgi:CheY-like chemotaxis protein